ncbi:MAG: PDZ domain-containing protein [Chthoniobacterales bacterium]|nr:PDZ domain-containing protein [Chthoniobacterales bacterium]
MKTRIALTNILAALIPLAAFAQTPTPPDVPPQPALAPAPPAPAVPPAPPVPPHHGMRHDDQPRGPYTFLGVETSRVSRVVSEQLGLPRGFGVVVDYVVPESAAAAAGLEQSDIIKMLNDQIVIDSEQLGILVRSFVDGTTVNLTVLRKGREMKLTAKLQQKQEKSGHDPVGYEWNFDGMDGMKDFHMPDMSAVREAVSRAKKEALRAGDEAREAARRLRIVTTDDGTLKSTHVDLGKAQIVFSDEKGELRLETVDGKKMLTAKDATGKVLFQGPIDTEEERAKVPAEVRKRYENLEHQDLPPIPPNEELAPRPPGPGESAHLHEADLEQAALAPSHRTGWVRSTLLL